MNTVQIGCVVAWCIYRRRNRRKRRFWVHPTLQSRLTTGQFHLKFHEHRGHPEKFFLYYRMSVQSFDKLLSLLIEKIAKKDTNMRVSISSAERLVITLR